MTEIMDHPTTAVTNADTSWINLNLIDVPQDARTHDPDKLESLAHDMAAGGQLQEIVVLRNGDRYEVLAGVGRTLAGRKLGWEKIRCLIKEGLSDFDKARITYAENEERENADPFYQAALLQKMKTAGSYENQRDLGKALGAQESEISRYLALADLPAEIQEKLKRFNFSKGQLDQLLRVPTPDVQLSLAEEASKEDLSVRQLKVLVDKQLGKAPTAEKEPAAKKPTADLAWKGEEIAINRHYKPAVESLEQYYTWLMEALPAFAETKPVSKNGQKENV